MHIFDPARLDLATEFKLNPIGPHSPDLMQVLRVMHWDRAEARYIALQPRRDGPWYLARSRGARGEPLDVYLERPYETLAEAHWAVFQKRWQQRAESLPVVDAGDEVDPAAGVTTPSSTLVSPMLTGYCDRFTARADETLNFKISGELAGCYRADLVRVRCGDGANLAFKQTLLESTLSGQYPTRFQPVQAGSFMQASGVSLDASWSFHVLIWPTLPGAAEQCVAGQWDHDTGRGTALMLDADGALSLRVGDGERIERLDTGVPLGRRHWHSVAASFDAGSGALWLAHSAHAPLTGLSAPTVESTGTATVDGKASVPFRLAACTASHAARSAGESASALHFNGKLEAPTVYASAVSPHDRAAFLVNACTDALARALVASWDFSRNMADTQVLDVSPHGRHGELINMPTRAMKGAQWNGTEYNWVHKPAHYAAVHFHDDDLHDCGWETDFSYTVPVDLPSGLYAVWLRQGDQQDWIPFVVSPPVGTANADLALLLPSASYWAYANRGTIIDFAGREQVRNAFTTADPTSLFLHHHPEFGLSMYDCHNDGSGVSISSRLRPVLSLRPNEGLWQLPADTHLIDWLSEKNFAFDIITEDDLDVHGVELLAPYRCVMTGTHPEYPSITMMEAYTAFQNRGGRFMYMGGNGFYWRVSYHPYLPGVMEMRRGEDGIRAWLAEGGEYYHAFTGELGGMWRRMGRAPQSVAGTGMTAQGFDRSTYFERTPGSFDERAAFIFEGVGADERIGDFGIIGGGAAGWEIDRADPELGTPPNALVVARAENFSSAYHWMKEELTHTHAAVTGDTCPHVHCDMVFYETANDGMVFSTSSIAWAGALAHDNYDNNVSRITENVVRRFLSPRA
jgi:N,N-dimethylformamidase